MANDKARLMFRGTKDSMRKDGVLVSEVYAGSDGSGSVIADGPTINVDTARHDRILGLLIRAIETNSDLPLLSILLNSSQFASQWNWRTRPEVERQGYIVVDSVGRKRSLFDLF